MLYAWLQDLHYIATILLVLLSEVNCAGTFISMIFYTLLQLPANTDLKSLKGVFPIHLLATLSVKNDLNTTF